MEYMLIFNSPTQDLELDPADERARPYFQSWRAYLKEIYAAGIVKSGNALAAPHTATTVRVRNDARQVHDGPFADTKEVLGGYLIIAVNDLDEALDWAARSPSSRSGSTEVRPVLSVPDA